MLTINDVKVLVIAWTVLAVVWGLTYLLFSLVQGNNMERIAVCAHTGLAIVQMYMDNEWICLHADTPEQDKVNVDNFNNGEQNEHN